MREKTRSSQTMRPPVVESVGRAVGLESREGDTVGASSVLVSWRTALPSARRMTTLNS